MTNESIGGREFIVNGVWLFYLNIQSMNGWQFNSNNEVLHVQIVLNSSKKVIMKAIFLGNFGNISLGNEEMFSRNFYKMFIDKF